MRYQITELFSNTWAVQDENVRCFILAGTEKALVIDSGISGPDLKKIASEVTDRPALLLNTHADPDHISGNAVFSSCYMHPSEAMVYHNIHHGTASIIPVYEGTVLDPGGRPLEIIHVPGHTPGSISVLDVNSRCLFGGDPVQKNGEIYMFGVHRDMEAYILGLRHLEEMAGRFDRIYPSHADMPVSNEMIGKLIAGAEQIQAGTAPFVPGVRHGQKIRVYDLGFDRILGPCTYRFFGQACADVPLREDVRSPQLPETPRDLYEILASGVWCEETCAPRLRDEWSRANITCGQCSVTAFLVQDLFGGKVYGILRPGGNYHCYNVVGDRVFDLTSAQFGDEKLDYHSPENPEQFREVHFAKEEKRQRYLLLRERLKRYYD